MVTKEKKKKGRRRTKSISKRNFTLLLVVTLAMTSIATYLFVSRPTDIDRLSQSYLDCIDSDTKLDELVKSSYANTFSLEDYTFYGESLKLYHSSDLSSVDSLEGQNVLLKNVETKDEVVYTFEDGCEDGIKTGSLKPGLYEIFVYDHFVKKRVYFTSKTHMSTPFETMRRNKKVLHVSLDADKNFLKDYKVNMDKNYAFLSVTENIPKVDTIDVLIDPCGDTYNPDLGQVTSGIEANKLTEQKEAYVFAKKVKKVLESYGLKVKLTRKEDGSPSYYGKKGRVGQGYEQNAKVFLSLGFSQDDEINRPYMVTSAYSSGSLADNVSYIMQKNGLELYDVNSSGQALNEAGVIVDSLMQDEDLKETKFEFYPQLRESGGKPTFAGQYDSALENQRYADSNGMYGLYFMFCNAYSSDSISYYQNNKKLLAKTLAESITDYFGIEKGDTDETDN